MAVMTQEQAYLALHRDYEKAIAERLKLIEALRNCVKAQDGTGGAKGSMELAATEGARKVLRDLGEMK